MRTLTDIFTPGAPTLPEGLRTLAVSPERELEPGMTVRAAFTFRNEGGAPATGVRVRFNLPEGLVYLVGSGRLDGVELDDEQGSSPLLSRAGAEIGDVAPGEERRIDLAYSVAGAIENGTAVEIQAALAAFELAPVGSNVVRLVAHSRPALANALTAMTLESRKAEPGPGDELSVTVRVHNAGESSAHDVVVDAPIPEHTSYVAGSARVNGREFERDLPGPFDRVRAPVVAPALSASATATLQYRVRVDHPLPDGTAIAAAARIASQETPAFGVAAAPLAVRAGADFADERTAFAVEPGGDAAPGSRVAFRLRAHNGGTAAAQSASVAFVLPEALVPIRGSASVDGQPLRERAKSGASYDLGSIPAGESVELIAYAMLASPLPDALQLSVEAVLRYDGSERSFERVISVRSSPHFAARRNRIERSGGEAVMPGSECEAVVFLANDGSAAASDVLLHLNVDPALEDLRISEKAARLECSGDTLEIGTLEAYASRKLTIRARVRSPYADGSEIRLGAALHAQETGEMPLGEARWRVDARPAFSPEGSGLSLPQDDVFRPNALIEVFVRLRNEGCDAAQNPRLRLYVSPEARLESVDGATRERSTIAFGEIAPGAEAQARLGVRLLRNSARSHPVSIEAVLTADGMLPVQLQPLTIVTAAEPDFSIGTLHSLPEEIVEAGEEMAFALHLRNSGDGAAQRVRIGVDRNDRTIYVPNSTSVNDVPVRDAGSQSPLTHERGLVLSDVDPGIEAVIRWREVVSSAAASGETLRRTARIDYDGERSDEIAAREIVVRSAPAFASSITGLPFGLDGVQRAQTAPPQQAITGHDVIELPPATPVARAVPAAPPVLSLGAHSANDAQAVAVLLSFDRSRLDRALHFLNEARFGGLLTHLFAIRTLFPDAAGHSAQPALDDLRETLRDSLDRLFIKLRLPNYAIAARDVEPPQARAALQRLLGTLQPGEAPPEPAAGTLMFRGTCDGEELHALREALAEAPGPALFWAIAARLLPSDDDALLHYRGLLSAALDECSSADDAAFAQALQRRKYPVLDAALDVVLLRLGNAGVTV